MAQQPITGAVGAAIDDLPDMWDGFLRKVRHGLGITAFGANVMNLPPDYETVAHDESHSGQQELYVGLRGSGWIVTPRRRALDARPRARRRGRATDLAHAGQRTGGPARAHHRLETRRLRGAGVARRRRRGMNGRDAVDRIEHAGGPASRLPPAARPRRRVRRVVRGQRRARGPHDGSPPHRWADRRPRRASPTGCRDPAADDRRPEIRGMAVRFVVDGKAAHDLVAATVRAFPTRNAAGLRGDRRAAPRGGWRAGRAAGAPSARPLPGPSTPRRWAACARRSGRASRRASRRRATTACTRSSSSRRTDAARRSATASCPSWASRR